jgi:uncharacterized protein YraI
LIGTVLVCAICALSGGLGFAITQEFTNLPDNTSTEAASSNEEAEALRAQIESLVAQVKILEASEPDVIFEPAAPAPTPQPFAIAHQSGATLRNGPGADYSKVGTLTLGARVEIVGRNNDSSWWLVSTPNGLAWVRADAVAAYDVNDAVPVVTIPGLLTLPATGSPSDPPGSANTPMPNPEGVTPPVPSGTPTASVVESRIFVEETVGWKRLFESMGTTPPTSASFSPKGDRWLLWPNPGG